MSASDKSASLPQYKVTIFVLGFFLLCFPKGGIKLGPIPITWGYLLLLFLALLLTPSFLSSGLREKFHWSRWLLIFSLLPLQAIVLFSFLALGVENSGLAASMVLSFLVFPFVFLVLFARFLESMDISYLLRMVRGSVFFVASFGIVLFFVKFKTGDFFEIPLLTVNLGDVGQLDEKFINRGDLFKLISTYNNGNIYGVCVLMLLPLYDFLESSRIRQYVVKTSLILTLSRTVWLGLIFYQLMKLVYIDRHLLREKILLVPKVLFSMRMKKKDLISIFLFLIVIFLLVTGIFFILVLMNTDSSFLVDRNLGGRLEQLDVLGEFSWFPGRPFIGLSEIVYLSVLDNFGFFGLISFLLAMFVPVLIGLLGKVPHGHSVYKKSLVTGVFVYLLVSMSDAAILYIPVMAFFWFVVGLLVSKDSRVEDFLVVRS